jgi:pimeloyl-ACP methyl ester carboxylesterase
MSDSKGFTDPSGLTRAQVLKRGFATGVAIGVPGVLANQARGATRTSKARYTVDGRGPFQVRVAREQLFDLRRRLDETRLPSMELVNDASQGVQLATIQALRDYWATRYDWRAFEASLNALPQFKTEIDGVGIHFIHVRSANENALPLIITHGWPGSIVEMLGVIGPLTDPTAYGGSAEDAFDVVVPSIPGFGFSDVPTSLGWGPGRVAQAWAELMSSLGYTRYVAQGGDVGAGVTDAMAIQAPNGLAGIHLNFLRRPPAAILLALLGIAPVPPLTPDEKAAFSAYGTQLKKGYNAEQSQSPETIGYSLTDSPIGQASWMLDHDADSYAKISGAFLGGPASGGLTPDHILDNMTLYWLTATGTSAARIYWEGARETAASLTQPPPTVSLPVGFTVFPNEIFQAPRSWVQEVYPNLIYFNEAAAGGHFAAWEEPQLFAEEVRAAFRSLR